MDPERWKQIRRVCHSALEIEPDRRKAYLKQTCVGDESLLKEVESLLAQEAEAAGVFDSPALDAAARALAEEKENEPQPVLVGCTLQHYRIVEKIGEGGMGVVYRARDEHLKRDVAIKVLPPELMTDPERKKRFVREARAASALNHPNIVTIHDVTSEGGIDFIAMELVAGKTLAQKIGRKGMKFDEVLKHAIQIADALAAAHAVGIVHRDLKPANILIAESGHVKVLDFGLAKLMRTLNGETADSSSAALSTEEGRIMGTAAYMSPEQAQGKTVDARSDIFSFGSILYEMATGNRPFAGNGNLATISAILTQNPSPIPGPFPNEFNKIVQRCLRKDPERRAQSMRDIVAALEDLKDQPLPDSSDKPASGITPRKYAAWGLIATLVILAAGALYIFRRQFLPESASFSIVPLTSYQGEVGEPSLSPDGSRVAFEWNGEKQDHYDIYIKPLGSGPPRKLTADPASSRKPVWSPDGNWISFYRGGDAFLISPEGGPERKLTNGRVYSWSPDSRFVLVRRGATSAPLAFHLVSVETGEGSGQVTSPRPGIRGDLEAVLAPDGKKLAFIRVPGTGNFFPNDIYVQPLYGDKASGTAWRLTTDNSYAYGLTWTPDGRELLFSSNRSGRRSIWRMKVSPGSEVRRVPGTDDAFESTISTSTPGRLIFQRWIINQNLWRMHIPEKGGPKEIPERIVATNGPEWDPQFSPDGKSLAFRSERSGFPEIMVSRNDGTNSISLTHFKGARTVGAPRWSPDGRLIAFDSQGPDNIKVYVISAQGGAARPLNSSGQMEVRPSWSRDGRWIYFGSNLTGTHQIWKCSASGDNIQQVTKKGGWEAFESPDGKILFYTKGAFTSPGLWNMPTAGGNEEPVSKLSSVFPGHWAVIDRGIYFVDFSDTGPQKSVPVKFFDFQKGELAVVGAIERIQLSPPVSFTATRDGRWVVWMQTDYLDSNLMMIDNFR